MTTAPSPVRARPEGPTDRSPLAPLRDAAARARRTTPGRLRLQSLVIVALAIATGLLASIVVRDRLATTLSIRDSSEPVIVSARQIQANLAEADAAAANAFLAGGIEDPEQRRRYEEALDEAGKSLAAVASLTEGDVESIEAVENMQTAVAEYSGLVETARANNRLGFPVGAAYLNAASNLLTQEDGVYEQTDIVANRGAQRYRSDYNGLLSTGLIPVVIAGLLALGLLIALLRTQTFISNTFRRRFNLPMAVATMLAMVLVAWFVIALAGSASGLRTARQDGFGDVRQFVDARALGFRAKAAESRYLIARGGGDAAEFDAEAERLTDALNQLDDDNGARADWRTYVEVHDEILLAESEGDRETAETLALVDANTEFDEFSDAVDAAIEQNQSQFSSSMNRASGAMRWLSPGSVILAAATALLALFGIQQRINEYR